MKTLRAYGVLACAGVVAVSAVLAGCNLLKYQFCINNFTSYDLIEVNIASQGAPSWGSNDLSAVLGPGGSEDIKGFSAGTYMVRGVFDIAGDPYLCDEVINGELIVVNEGIDITTTNVCIDYEEISGFVDDSKSEACTTIYGAVRFEI